MPSVADLDFATRATALAITRVGVVCALVGAIVILTLWVKK